MIPEWVSFQYDTHSHSTFKLNNSLSNENTVTETSVDRKHELAS